LKVLRKKDHKSKSKTTSSRNYHSESEEEKQERDSLRVGKYYQPHPHTDHRRERKPKEVRVDLSHFHGKDH